ncbi:ABC transporter ATP-binding protein/permease [Novosphingobium olei]|uniref:ABC transporter ATP-binding protein/permease n=1 Tax=Novosphingobium olei TaxID=2728851 RepID=A0A7Y0BP24_9SPHN|nr:ABC transporter ATP-binding protein/permease [Novosphingobium olei]NML93975.1 ABC transporter ATP-binding protein/permease [Novosphingobium olei]
MNASASPLPEGPAPVAATRRWNHALRLLGGFWSGREAPVAWAMLAVLLGLQFGTATLGLWMAEWEKTFFDMLQTRQGDLAASLLRFAGIVGAFAAVGFATSYLSATLALRWRAWLNADYTARWMAWRRYYRIERSGTLDNPDQRIAEDLDLLSRGILGLVTGFTFAVVSLVQFTGLLLSLSAPLTITVLGHALVLPGDMVIWGFVYAVGTSVLVVFVGRPIVARTMRQQHFEADYRFELIHVRRNAEQIAFSRAEPVELGNLAARFSALRRNMHGLILATTNLGVVQGLISQLTPMTPILLMLPRYFAGRMTIGDVMQGRNAFNQMSVALSWFMQSYGSIATQIAIIRRLRAFDAALALPPADAAADLEIGECHEPALHARDLAVRLPSGPLLVTVPDWQVEIGERWVVRGPSGAGKSTLLRVIAGLWPEASGHLAHLPQERMMFLPQRAYFPIGPLRAALAFPASADAFAAADLAAALARFNLAHLEARLDEVAPWTDVLSPGEQQRLAFIRVLLHRPDMLVMDEATSALDAGNAALAYSAVLQALPGLTLISVVHDDALEIHHTHLLHIADGIARRASLRP